MTDCRTLCEHAQLALAFTDAAIEENRINQRDILSMLSNEELIGGFVYLVGSLRMTGAAASGVTAREFDDIARKMLLVGGDFGVRSVDSARSLFLLMGGE